MAPFEQCLRQRVSAQPPHHAAIWRVTTTLCCAAGTARRSGFKVVRVCNSAGTNSTRPLAHSHDRTTTTDSRSGGGVEWSCTYKGPPCLDAFQAAPSSQEAGVLMVEEQAAASRGARQELLPQEHRKRLQPTLKNRERQRGWARITPWA